jgi:hypothetical protein
MLNKLRHWLSFEIPALQIRLDVHLDPYLDEAVGPGTVALSSL